MGGPRHGKNLRITLDLVFINKQVFRTKQMIFSRSGMVLIAFVYSNTWCVLQSALERADCLAGFVRGMVSPIGYLSNRVQPYSRHPSQ